MSTHIDPKAPADSPLHPANHGRVLDFDPEDSTLTDAEQEEYERLLADFGSEAEQQAVHRDGEDGPALDDLRKREIQHDQEAAERSRLTELYGPEHAELLIEFGSPEERAEGAELVPTPVLLERRDAAEGVDSGSTEELKRPPKDAPRAKWVAYAKQLDPDLTDDDLKPITVAGLREMTALQDETAEAEA